MISLSLSQNLTNLFPSSFPRISFILELYVCIDLTDNKNNFENNFDLKILNFKIKRI